MRTGLRIFSWVVCVGPDRIHPRGGAPRGRSIQESGFSCQNGGVPPGGASIREPVFRIQNRGGEEPNSPAPSGRGYNILIADLPLRSRGLTRSSGSGRTWARHSAIKNGGGRTAPRPAGAATAGRGSATGGQAVPAPSSRAQQAEPLRNPIRNLGGLGGLGERGSGDAPKGAVFRIRY